MEKQRTDGPTRRRSPVPPGTDGGSTRRSSVGLSTLLDSVPGAWFFTRRDGSFAYVSLGACEALGYSREELLAARVFDLDPTMNPERWAGHWDSMLPGHSRTLRTVHRRRDGTEYPIEIRSHQLELDGELLSASYSVDLTLSEQTQAALTATESRLQRLLEHLPDLVFRLRLEPRPTLEFVSPSSKALLGYWPSDLVGDEHAIARLLHPDDREQFLRLHELPPRTGRKLRFLDRDRQLVWMELRVAPVTMTDGAPHVIEGVARDVTQSHHAELQSRRLLAAIEQAAEAVVVTNGEGVVEYVNPAYRHTSGIAERDALGRPWRELEVRKDTAFLRRLSAALGKGEVWQGRIQSERTSGARYDEDATLAPIRDEAGLQVGCVAVKRDVTEQLALEEQLHQAQKLEAVGQLAGGIAHDFNNLLHVIQGHTHMMQALDLDGFPHEGDLMEMLGEVDKAAERAATLVRQLLAFSRKGGAEFSELRLDELVASLHGMLHRILGPHIQLMLNCNAGRVVILGNAAQLEQMIANLCINARDAMRPGGYVHITLEPAAPGELPPLFRSRAEEAYVRLTVRDDGAGMTRDVQRRLYEPFFTTKQPGEGVGLGLATVYAIVQGHQGFIDSMSARGKGTTFNVYLPRIDGVGRVGARLPSRARVEGRGRLVLVAEDEPAVLQLTSCYLRQAGFEVMLASNGPEAERLLDERGSEIALAVLDAVMPGFGGQGVHQAMKDRNITCPVIFVTGYDYQTLAGAAGEEGVAMLQKPFGQSELLDQVGRLLEGSLEGSSERSLERSSEQPT
jgi:two-component system cell cycle sensor histidine kinase/response regulator CckA